MEHKPVIAVRFFYRINLGGESSMVSIDNTQRGFVTEDIYKKLEKNARELIMKNQKVSEEDIELVTEEECENILNYETHQRYNKD